MVETHARNPGWHAALASPVRRRVIELLLQSDAPLDAVAVADHLALHVTTARFHLEQLESAGLVRREVHRAAQRGRPRILFSVVPTSQDDVQEQLNHALASVIAEDSDGGRARAIRAGESWSAGFAGPLATRPDDGITPVVRLLADLEFGPVVEDSGRSIALTACPFREEARQNPAVICSVHLGLLRWVATTLGHSQESVTLRPFVHPNLCVVHLDGDWATGAA